MADAPEAFSSAGPEPRFTTLTAMSYNILIGSNWDKTRQLIRDNPADIICLQEIPEDNHPHPGTTGLSQIAADLDMPHEMEFLWHTAPRRFGNMTLVAGRISESRILHAPPSRPYGMLNDVEIRGARLTIANIHLSPVIGLPPIGFPITEPLRLREARHLTRSVEAISSPVIAVGDFNSFWPAPTCVHMRKRWRDCRTEDSGPRHATRPTYGIPFVIDHIFVRGNVRIRDYRVLLGGGSDHRAVIAALDVPIHR
jgi:endonuclease/exonuclease/phosphatase family metal-dependent hydrolase